MIGSGRREARERALELLYEAEAKGVDPAEVIQALPAAPDPYAAAVAVGVHDELDRLDEVLGRIARGWTVKRMPTVDRALLRMAAWELGHSADVPVAVVISEAVELAKRFSTDDSARFVNGVLAKVARELRPAGAEHDAAATEVPAAVERPAPTVDCLVLDVDGVIRFWNESELFAAAAALGLEPGALFDVAFEDSLLHSALTGELTEEEWRAEVGRRAAERHGVDPGTAAALFGDIGWRVDEDMVDLIAEVRSRVPVWLFSNATTRLEADLEACEVAGAVDGVISSARLGLAKPDPEAYRAAAKAIGLPIERCLFVDDRAENVAGAEVAGMQSAPYAGVEALRRLLATHNLL